MKLEAVVLHILRDPREARWLIIPSEGKSFWEESLRSVTAAIREYRSRHLIVRTRFGKLRRRGERG